jgi:hypothetical protein
LGLQGAGSRVEPDRLAADLVELVVRVDYQPEKGGDELGTCSHGGGAGQPRICEFLANRDEADSVGDAPAHEEPDGGDTESRDSP